jgi:hypothetical protein
VKNHAPDHVVHVPGAGSPRHPGTPDGLVDQGVINEGREIASSPKALTARTCSARTGLSELSCPLAAATPRDSPASPSTCTCSTGGVFVQSRRQRHPYQS